MSKKGENLEIKIYELLGVKTFRKMAFGLSKTLLFLFTIFMTKEERRELYSIPSNYNMKNGNGLQDLRDFKLMLLNNAIVHVLGLLVCLPNFLLVVSGAASIFTVIINITAIVMNLYCIMLQRYNHIRINRVLKKGEAIEQKQVLGKIKEQSDISRVTHKVVSRKGKEKIISFDDFLQTATLEQLKEYKKSLEYLYIRENSVLYPSDEFILTDTIPLEKGKSLKLEISRKK